MTVRKQWIQSATVGVDEETGALLVLPAGISNADRVEMKVALPNATHKEIALGKTVHTLILSVPSGASCTYSLKGVADANSPDLDATMLMREESPEGVSSISVYCAGNMSTYKISIRAW